MNDHENPRTTQPSLSRARVGILLLAGLAWLAFTPMAAHAECGFRAGTSQGTYLVGVPSTIVNDPNIAVGAVLFTSSPTGINQTVKFHCDKDGPNSWGLLNASGSPTPGITEKLFPTNLAGVGFRVLQKGTYIYPYPYMDLGTKSNWTENDAVTIELVKTGDIANGDTLQGQLATFKAGTAGNYIIDAVINLANPLTFIAPACSANTSNIDVVLPTVSNQDFSGPDSVVGTKPFKIEMTCSAGATVRITLDTSNRVPGKPGVMAPSSGTTTGVGVQLLDSSGTTPVEFGVAKTIGATPNGALSADYFARYYQTGTSVTAGSLSATATFTLSYQ